MVGAADAPAKAAMCVSCHGANGISSNPLWPNLAGQQQMYLAKQMKAFRDGDRSDPLMTPMSMGLSDDDIDALAAYYAALPAGG
jgi:cytochrome c553